MGVYKSRMIRTKEQRDKLIYPSRDKDNKLIDAQTNWKDEILRLLEQIEENTRK